FGRLKENLEAVRLSNPHAVTLIEEAAGPVIDCGGQHAWIAADAALELATDNLRTGGTGRVEVRNATELCELKVAEGLAQRFGLKAQVTFNVTAGTARIAVSPATEVGDIGLLDHIRRDGLVVDAALWWTLFHQSAEALAPDSYLSRRHAGPIIVEADGKVI